MFTVDQLHQVFTNLSNQGIFAPQQPWMCCQGCGCAAVPEAQPYVFYHEQDAESCAQHQNLYLAFGGNCTLDTVTVGQLIVESLAQVGAIVEWDGTEGTRIVVEVAEMENPYQDDEEEEDIYEDPWADEEDE